MCETSAFEPKTWLPEAIPLEHFKTQFFGKVALHYWQNPDVERLCDALVPVAEMLEPAELVGLASTIEEEFAYSIEDEDAHIARYMWYDISEVQLREDGIVVAKVGTPQNVIEYLQGYVEDYPDEASEVLECHIVEAAYQYRDDEFAEFVMHMFRREEDRRVN